VVSGDGEFVVFITIIINTNRLVLRC